MTDIKQTLVQLVKFRTASTGKSIQNDDSYQESDIFNDSEIRQALELSLRAFNMIPAITYFKWNDEEIVDMISDLLVTYASYLLLSRQSLTEKGREFAINDSGVSFNPPDLSNMTFALANEMWRTWEVQVRTLKESDNFYEDFVQDDDGEDDED